MSHQNNKPASIILLTSDFYPSAATAVRTFMEQTERHNIRVTGIVAVNTFHPLHRKSWRTTLKFLRETGYIFAAKHIAMNIWHTNVARVMQLFKPYHQRENVTIDQIAQHYNITLHKTGDINDAKLLSTITKIKPDYLVSCLLLQIIKKPLLQTAKKASVNFHPALTQQHRGTWGGFWALKNQWQHGGATVHYMTEQLDEGAVILQKKFRIHSSDSLWCVNDKAAQLGGRLLAKAIRKLEKSTRPRTKKLRRLGKIFKMPSPVAIGHFLAQGKRIFKWKNFWWT